MTQIDLTNCDLEPIHIPGKIQHHGYLVAIDKAFNIMYCSQNLADMIAIPAVTCLGKPVSLVENIIKKENPGFIQNLVKISQTLRGFDTINPYPVNIDGADLNMIINASGELYLIEFEPALSDLASDLQQAIGSSLSGMLGDNNLSTLLHKTAEQIKSIINYDRVMVYRFHDDGHGEVIAEAKNDDLEQWVGLHYPASDIPKQARELYKKNLTRLIADVATEPSPIMTLARLNAVPLDLTQSALRAVSPVHIQYLKNMGVASSFSVSLLHQGELWGLVACHNYTPRFISYKQRDAARLIGQVLSSALSFRQQEEDQQKKYKLKLSVDVLTKQLMRYNDIDEALLKYDITLLDAVDATGAVLVFDNHMSHKGKTPPDAFIKDIVAWLNNNMVDSMFATNQLSDDIPAALAYKDIASGMLACRLSKELKEYMLWFRPEVITSVNWAGNPDKPVVMDGNGLMSISPRTSFERWSEQVQLISVSWKSEDIYSAMQLKEEVTFAISRKATEIRVLNDKLKEAYDELDAFSYTISHDLKNPLTTIKSYSQLLTRFELDPKAQRMVEGILSGANRMQAMIEEVLNYSRTGQEKAQARHVNMRELLTDIKQQLLVANEDIDITINIAATPDIYGDATMVQQVFSNLVGNAVKYSRNTATPVISVIGEDTGDGIQYRIKDNGIGISVKDQYKIFDLFKRSDDVSDYEGSGVGLAIVKKIMEKHHGKVWVDSKPGQGSTFYVLFNKQE